MAFDIGSIIGGTVGDAFAKIVGVFKADPTKALEVQGELTKIQAEMQGKLIDSISGQIAQVNQTMREEAKSVHWIQYTWRPIVGFTLAGVIVNNYILLPYAQAFGVHPIDIPDKVWEVMLAVVGVSALTRGVEKAVEVYKAVGEKK